MNARWLTLAVVLSAALAGAPAAFADSSQSTNWAGYAVHRSGVSFDRVVGSWTQPAAACTAGDPTYSSLWVGLGGYSTSSSALEQIGTEEDCTAQGTAVASAWYELVPAPSRTVALKLVAGDRMRAVVAISGRLVTLTLADLTSHRTFTRTIRTSPLDQTSAEWIMEAPSVCAGSTDCTTLPLAAFGTATFTAASARSTAGHTGTISDRHWGASEISMVTSGRHFIGGPPGPAGLGVTAIPSSLTAGGSAFNVSYHGTSAQSTGSSGVSSSARRLTTGRRVAPAALTRPGRLSHKA